MRQRQKDALRVIREARAYATETSNSRLHLACSRSIEAMITDGCMMPSELRLYAQQVRAFYITLETERAHPNAAAMAE